MSQTQAEKNRTQACHYLQADALAALDKGQLGAALHALTGVSAFVPAIHDEAETLFADYRRLLAYFATGATDPERASLIATMTRRAYHVLTLSQWQGTPTPPLASLAGSALFDALYLAPLWREGERCEAQALIDDERRSESDKCLLLSAVTLRALHYFDDQRLALLLYAAGHASIALRARALAGAVLICLRFAPRIMRYPALTAQLELLLESEATRAELLAVQMQLFLSQETKRIAQRVQDDLLPALKRHIKQARAEGLFTREGKEEMTAALEANPEWLYNQQDEKLTETLRSLTQMQEKGADMFLTTFSALKKRLPFFSIPSNWFLPFSLGHEMVREARQRYPFLGRIVREALMCDSDRYSLCAVFLHMPAAMSEKAQAQLAPFAKGDEADDVPPRHDAAFASEVRNVVQGLYRYFKLYRGAEAAADPFGLDLSLAASPLLRAAVAREDTLQHLAAFTFSIDAFPQALALYRLVPPSADVLQHIGYCLQAQGDYAGAAEAYDRALLFSEHSPWTLRQRAYCLRLQQDYPRAAEAYAAALEGDGDNVRLLLRLSECFIELGRYEEALRHLFKAHYLDAASPAALRALVWCMLQVGRYADAAKYADKLSSASRRALPADLVNAGHAALLCHDMPTALALYARAVSLLPEAERTARQLLSTEIDFLHSKGIADDTLRLIEDAVELQLEAGQAAAH